MEQKRIRVEGTFLAVESVPLIYVYHSYTTLLSCCGNCIYVAEWFFHRFVHVHRVGNDGEAFFSHKCHHQHQIRACSMRAQFA